MNEICSVSGCKIDRAYAVLVDDKVYRISFSKSICEHLASLIEGA